MPFDLPFEYLSRMSVWLIAGIVCLYLLLRKRRSWTRRKSPRVFWANLGLSLWMFLAALTLVELYFAIIYDQSDSFNMTNVSKHWFMRHERLNPQGFRDEKPMMKSIPEGVRRVLFVGDSFTYGHGIKNVADRFSDRIERSLEAAQPGKFTVSNAGLCGVHILLIENMVEKIVEHGYQVDVLVYSVCLNDIDGFKESQTDMDQRLAVHSPSFPLFRDTFFLNMLYFRIQQASQPELRNYYGDMAQFYESAAWDRMRAELDRFHDFCRDHQIDLRIAIFPFLHNLGPDYAFDVAHKRIAEYCRGQGIPCLDLKPVLQPHAAEGLTVNRFDAHPNERAHALAAEAMEKDLLADLFEEVPPKPTAARSEPTP